MWLVLCLKLCRFSFRWHYDVATHKYKKHQYIDFVPKNNVPKKLPKGIIPSKLKHDTQQQSASRPTLTTCTRNRHTCLSPRIGWENTRANKGLGERRLLTAMYRRLVLTPGGKPAPQTRFFVLKDRLR